eukprot:m.234837 g.234837  ORF g.234837 m.234837 type:complete len:685 (+) comp17392_c0_seq4:199-2253(+)
MVFEYEQHYFHGRLARVDAEQALAKSRTNGLYLIRTSSSGDGYSLSMFFSAEVMHFQVRSQGECWFSIDDGPLYEGLDGIINHYTTLSDGLPVPLTKPLPTGKRPKPTDGNTKLHTACFKGDPNGLKKYKSQADLNAVNKNKRTPLHEACRGKHLAIVREFLDMAARTQVPIDTPDAQGWTPLHMAAATGAADVVRELVLVRANFRLRSLDNETPRAVAARYGNTECCKILGDAESGCLTAPQLDNKAMPWYHGKLNRAAAEHVLSLHGMRDGLFLARESSSVANDYVLTLAFEGDAYHFQIAHQGEGCYAIDDGPTIQGLTDIVEYYTTTADGLPCSLKQYAKRSSRGLSPSTGAVQQEDIYGTATMNKPSSTLKMVRPGGSKPARQARPSNVGSDYHLLRDSSLPAPPPTSSSPHVIDPKTIEMGKKLGSGEFGAVCQGTWHNGAQSIQVAIKTMKKELVGTADQEFLREANLMVSLKHRNVVSLLGICLPPDLMIVQELMPLGALQDYLEARPYKIKSDQLIKWAAEVANGMSYLEKKKFVHRDLATRNILLNENSEAKISDFGLSRVYEDNYYKASAGGKWPIKWYAPESIYYGKFTTRSDVWSFAVTLWEIFSFAQMPYGDLSGQEVVKMIEAGERLKGPKGCPPKVYAIMLECWAMEANDRPSFVQLLTKFTDLLQKR